MGWKEPLEDGIAVYSRILAWRIPWTEGPGGPQSIGSQRDLKELDVTEVTERVHRRAFMGQLLRVVRPPNLASSARCSCPLDSCKCNEFFIQPTSTYLDLLYAVR